jgi:hypothetical protein
LRCRQFCLPAVTDGFVVLCLCCAVLPLAADVVFPAISRLLRWRIRVFENRPRESGAFGLHETCCGPQAFSPSFDVVYCNGNHYQLCLTRAQNAAFVAATKDGTLSKVREENELLEDPAQWDWGEEADGAPPVSAATATATAAPATRKDSQTKPVVNRKSPEFAVVIGSGVEVKKSTIAGAGRGLFAAVAFNVGEYVTEYDGELISWNEAVERRAAGRASHIRTLESQHCAIDGRELEPRSGRGGASFINDSKDGRVNVKFVTLTCLKGCERSADRLSNRGSEAAGVVGALRSNAATYVAANTKRCFVKALKPIGIGEEIFVSYDDQYWV